MCQNTQDRVSLAPLAHHVPVKFIFNKKWGKICGFTCSQYHVIKQVKK